MKDEYTFIENSTWYRHGTDYRAAFGGPACIAYVEEMQPYSVLLVNYRCHHKGYSSREYFKKKFRGIVDGQLKDKAAIDRIYRKWRVELGKVNKLVRTAGKIDFKREEFSKLKRFTAELYEKDITAWRKSFVIEMADSESWDTLKEIASQEGCQVPEHELKELTHSEKRNYLQDKELALLKITLKVKKQEILSRRLQLAQLSSLAAKYFYIKNGWCNTYVLSADDFYQEMKENLVKSEDAIAKEIHYLENYAGNVKKTKRDILKKHGCSNKVMNLLHFLTVLGYMRDERKQMTQIVNHYFNQFAERSAREWKISPDLMLESHGRELGQLPGRLSSEKRMRLVHGLRQRKELNIILSRKKETTEFVTGRKAYEIMNRLEKQFLSQFTEIKGNIGNRGCCIARVKVIRGDSEFHKFKPGDIIVTSQTRPEYVPLMKKAAGIITDEGGVTCHAAIVSRELGIPCIIGTQVATKLLKDNDLVELDANRGVVRKVR